jgi:hypothetical protein
MNAIIPKTLLVPKVRRVRVYPRLNLAIRQRLTAYCARKGLTERDAIEEAIVQYLDGSSDSAKVLGQLQRLALTLDAERERRDEAHREVHGALEVLSEAFGRFLRLWMFVHAAAFQRPATVEAADGLYQQFAAKLAEYFLRGHRFLDDLPKVGDARSRTAG